MMGLQVTASKRKLEDDGKGLQAPQPAKVGRTEETVREAVVDVAPAPDLDDWRVDSTSSVLASTLLGSSSEAELVEDDDDEDEDDDDDEEEEEEKGGKYLPAGRGYQCVRYGGDGMEVGSGCYSHAVELKPMGYYGTGEDQGGYSGGASQTQYGSRNQHYQSRSVSQYWGPQNASEGSSGVEYYGQDPSSQQTIRCDENGKSYLDLGSSSARYVSGVSSSNNTNSTSGGNGGASNTKCCDGSRTNWCSQGPNTACYRQRRLAVLNISMCKLGRYRQFPDPSLHRSVLICNTLRYIEREMEQEGFFFNNATGTLQAPVPPPPSPTPHPAVEPDPSYHHPQFPEVPAPNMSYPAPGASYRTLNPCPEIVPQYEQNLRDLSMSGRATPFPSSIHPSYETDSGMGDEESGRGINWGSVLSLSSQSDLDPLNNNELYPSSPSHSSSSSSSSLPGLGPSDNSGSLGLLGDMDLGHEFDDFLPSWKLTPLSADDILKSVPSSEFSGRQGEGELDSIMHVLVGT
ncbi:hypothetical protein C0J52_27801 [Blattella germanica]|nr:hypothetical protein C0J52_27801 [Blattella germanica]